MNIAIDLVVGPAAPLPARSLLDHDPEPECLPSDAYALVDVDDDPFAPDLSTQDERLHAVEQWERIKATADAGQVRYRYAMAAETGPEWLTSVRRREMVVLEIRTSMRWSAGYTEKRLRVAEALCTRFSDTLALLENGAISFGIAESLVELTRNLDSAIAVQVEARVLPRAPEQHQAAFRRSVKLAIARLDPRGAKERHDAADADRKVTYSPAGDAMAWINAYLPAAEAQVVMTAVQAVADRMCSTAPAAEHRNADQWRADALVALCSSVLCEKTTAGACGWDGYLPRWQGQRPSINVVVALSTLYGKDDQPGELTGYGAIPAELARRIAADPTGTWRRLVTDKMGRLVDYGRTVYRPPADLRDFIIARDRTSRFPGDDRDARRCDIDHRIRYADGGPTNEPNLHCLSGLPHIAKDECGWSAELTADGITRWTSPLGRVHDVRPDPYPTDTTADRPAVSSTDHRDEFEAEAPPF